MRNVQHGSVPILVWDLSPLSLLIVDTGGAKLELNSGPECDRTNRAAP
jgi:hypothetical protein